MWDHWWQEWAYSLHQRVIVHCLSCPQLPKWPNSGTEHAGYTPGDPRCVPEAEAVLRDGVGGRQDGWEENALNFFPEGAKINKDVYLELLCDQLLPWLQAVYRDAPYTFSQDGAPARTVHTIQNWSKENFPDFWPKKLRPPSRPDLNVMDYSKWAFLKSKACAKPTITLTH